MITVNVDQACKDLKRFFANLSKQEIAKAQSAAINRTLIYGRSEIKKFIRGNYNIKSNELKSLFIKKASYNRLSGNITAPKKNISLSHFNPSFDFSSRGKISTIRITRTKNGLQKSTKSKRGSTGKGVSVEIKKGERVNLPYAFMIKDNNTMPVFARGKYKTGGGYNFMHNKKRLPITKLLSTSIGAISTNNKMQRKLKADLTPEFRKRMIHELNFRLKKVR